MVQPPLTSSQFVAISSSSTHIGTTISDLALLAYPLPLAQRTGLEISVHANGDVSIIEDDSFTRSKEPTLGEPYLEETFFKEL